MTDLSTQISLISSLFKGREDVFAIRWESGNKAGYMPAYYFDPHRFKIHKINGGTFQNYKDKTFLRLTTDQIAKHLKGQQSIGVYPLLIDNTSWFIAADFDEKNWQADSLKFVISCREKKIPVYVEKSRSGNGCHVWIFFEQPYPANKSRELILHILTNCGAISIFDKDASFDRLFPNQDKLSGKGLGNLIAIPFNQLSLEAGNSCFVEPETQLPYKDQWAFLAQIERIPSSRLDSLYEELIDNTPTANPKKLEILLSNTTIIKRYTANEKIITFLRQALNIPPTSIKCFLREIFTIKNLHGKLRCLISPMTMLVLPKNGQLKKASALA